MNSTELILLIAAFFISTKVFKYFMIVKVLLKMRFKKADGEIKQLNELPKYLDTLFSSYDVKLKKLGFSLSHLHLLNTCVVSNFSQQWNLVYFNEGNNCYANVIVSHLPEAYEPVKVEFNNIFSDISRLVTVNGVECNVIGEIPNTILYDSYAPTLEQQYTTHIEKLKTLNRESIKLDAQDYLANEIQANNDYIFSLVQKTYLKPQDEKIYQLRLLPAIKHTFKILRGRKKIADLKAAQFKAAGVEKIEPVQIPVKVEVDAFLQLEDSFNQPDSGFGWKLMVFLFSFFLCIAIFGTAFSFSIALYLIVVLIIHELGHYIAMLIFGYSDRQILFLPFGAATLGRKDDANALQKAVVFLSGPALGLIAGTICIVAGIRNEIESLEYCGFFSLVLNYINLLPIMPLDGGRLCELVLFSRVPVLKSVFLIISLFVVVIAAILLKDPILIFFSIFIFISVRTRIVINTAHSQIKKQIKNQQVQPDKQSILLEIFQYLKQKTFARLPFAKKYAISKEIVSELMQKPPGLTETIVSLALYFMVIIFPILVIAPTLMF